MPNWIKGSFRARGSKEDIKKFIMEGLGPIGLIIGEEKIKKELSYEDNESLEFAFERLDDGKRVEMLHISGLNRHFLELEVSCINAYKTKKDDFYFASYFRSAWGIDTGGIVEIAKKYNIDIRVNGYECGQEFEQLFEVSRKGKIKCESYIEYEDYLWECPMPLLGG